MLEGLYTSPGGLARARRSWLRDVTMNSSST